MLEIYREDLAYVHNVGFGAFAKAAAEYLVELFDTPPHSITRILDVGCGSGITTRVFADAGLSVIGIEPSPAMIDLARRAAPHAEFIQRSAYEVGLPSSDAIVAIGEVLNYHSEPNRADELIRKFFQSAYAALNSGGLFVFDVIINGAPLLDAKTWVSGEDWAVLVNTTENTACHTLVREIEIFRARTKYYRRTRERHSIRVFNSAELRNWLTEFGFDVEIGSGYGDSQLLPRRIAVTAHRK